MFFVRFQTHNNSAVLLCLQDDRGMQLRIGATHEGLVTFHGGNRINLFEWYDFLSQHNVVRFLQLSTY